MSGITYLTDVVLITCIVAHGRGDEAAGAQLAQTGDVLDGELKEGAREGGSEGGREGVCVCCSRRHVSHVCV